MSRLKSSVFTLFNYFVATGRVFSLRRKPTYTGLVIPDPP